LEIFPVLSEDLFECFLVNMFRGKMHPSKVFGKNKQALYCAYLIVDTLFVVYVCAYEQISTGSSINS
jgi:hypothetical protein